MDKEWIRLTYGHLPTREQFDQQWNAVMESKTEYRFGNDYRMGDDELTQNELWRELLRASVEYHEVDPMLDDSERAGDWISAVLYTLLIEWV